MGTPLVSICIPVYNRKDIILTTVKAALAQDYSNFEVVVSDNNSDDGTFELLVEMAQHEPRIQLLRLPENRGPVANWANCFEHSRGEFVKFLWSDDYMAPSFLSRCMALFSHDVGFVFAKTSLYETDASEPAMCILFEHGDTGWMPSDRYIKGLVLGNIAQYPCSGTAALFRRDSVAEALTFQVPNPLALDFSKTGAGPDAMMFLSAALQYKRVGYCSEIVARYGTGYGSISVNEGESLSPYYNTYYTWIVCAHYPALSSLYKTRLFFSKVFAKKIRVKHQLNGLFDLIPGSVRWPFFGYLFWKNLVGYIQNACRKWL